MISDNYIATEFGGRVHNTRERGLPKVMAMIEVSCKTGYHIRELRQLIYSTSYEIKEKGSLIKMFELMLMHTVGKYMRYFFLLFRARLFGYISSSSSSSVGGGRKGHHIILGNLTK